MPPARRVNWCSVRAPSPVVSYPGRFRTKSATLAPVLQGNMENTGTLSANADGSFSYKFALPNGSTAGDIRTINHAHNVSTIAPSGMICIAFRN